MIPFKVGLHTSTKQREFLRFFKIPYEKYDTITSSEYAVSLLRNETKQDGVQHAVLEMPDQLGSKANFYRIDDNITIYCRLSKKSTRYGQNIISSIYDTSGKPVADITIDQKNKVIYLPFSIDEVIKNYLFERYIIPNRKMQFLRNLYYYLKPYMPEHLQLSFRRGFFRRKFANLQNLKVFPSWPIEKSLIDFYHYILKLLLKASKDRCLPLISFWPCDNDFCITLTHDADSAEGFGQLSEVADIDKQYNFRSSIYIVPELYPVDFSLLDSLRHDGFEIGLHGLSHDGKLFSSTDIFLKRANKINQYVKKWQAAGFRSPTSYRDYRLLKHLQIEYDTSYHDNAIYEPQPGGCCSLFPYFIDDIIELPITLPQDHTLFNILLEKTAETWINKALEIQKSKGMVLICTHSDYIHLKEWQDHYKSILKYLATKNNYWHALPCEVARWWRYRDDLEIIKKGRAIVLNRESDTASIKYVELLKDDLVFGILKR